MTTDVELLPLPSEIRLAIRAYARACVEANLAPLQAEIEALRAEVERLRTDRDSWEQQASDRVADWHAEHLRAERLAEAVRRYRNEVPIGHQPHMLAHEVDDLLREQEADRE